MSLPGLWNIACCLYSLITRTPVGYNVLEHGTGEGMLAAAPWTETSHTDPPGGGAWWMMFVLGLLWVALAALILVVNWWLPRERARLAALRASRPKPTERTQEIWHVVFAAQWRRARRQSAVTYGVGVGLALVGMAITMWSDMKVRWPMAVGMVSMFGLSIAA
ncbi:MAG: hypothetical protein KKI08_18295, partial [Armatimonadetes bacterium]|nr:hypothetical protein [Armatimonadota bacterium]